MEPLSSNLEDCGGTRINVMSLHFLELIRMVSEDERGGTKNRAEQFESYETDLSHYEE